MRQLAVLYRLVKNYFFNENFRGKNFNRSISYHVLFLLNISLVYNLLCAWWVKTYNWAFSGNAAVTAASRAMIARGFLFGGLRFLGPEDKNSFVRSVILPKEAPDTVTPLHTDSEAIVQLRRRGYVSLGRFFDAETCEKVGNYFCSPSGYASQAPLQSDGVLRPFDLKKIRAEKSVRYFCFPDETSLKCEPLRNALQDGRLSQIAQYYLGFPAHLYSINTFMSLNNPGDHYVMRVHRDYDDFNALAFFIYWSDVSASNGATIYVPGSHLSSDVDTSKIDYLVGEAGAVFALDSFGIHAGNKMVDRFRLVTWIRYGLVPNLAT